jgi:hypothetical protein
LLANAGRGLGRAFLDQDFEEIRRVIDTNVTGTVDLLQRVGRNMRERGEGRCSSGEPVKTSPEPLPVGAGGTGGGRRELIARRIDARRAHEAIEHVRRRGKMWLLRLVRYLGTS